MTDELAMSVRGLSKRFQAVQALDEVDLDVAGGVVHALLGENGSGKSTLIKILAGYHSADAGSIRVAGKELPLGSPTALAHGVAVIHQDLGLVDGMSVLDNLGVNMSYGTRLLLPVPVSDQRAVYGKLIHDLGLAIDLDQTVESLSSAERALVAIVRAIHALETRATTLFVLDEPTAYLPQSEAARVTALMRAIAGRGTGVLFVSHRLEEVMAVSDFVTVLRDGRVVASGPTSALSREEIVAAMLGEKAASAIQQGPDVVAQGFESAPVLEVAHVSGLGVHDVSFAAVGGEVLGVTGLTGMGQEELAKLIAGALPRKGGRVCVDGMEVAAGSPRALIRRGAVFVPSDRGRLGLWESGSASENLTLPALRRFFRCGVLRRRAEESQSESLMRQYSVRPPSPGLPVWSFSGGNQQKLLLAKWLQSQPRLVLVAEPTQGVDVAARSEILGVLRRMAAEGSCVTIFSSDHEFLAQACHRVLVMHQGRIGQELVGGDVTEDKLVLSAQQTSAAALSTGVG